MLLAAAVDWGSLAHCYVNVSNMLWVFSFLLGTRPSQPARAHYWETLIHEPQITSGGEEVFQALLSIYDIISDSIMKWQDKTDFLLHKYHDILREAWEE